MSLLCGSGSFGLELVLKYKQCGNERIKYITRVCVDMMCVGVIVCAGAMCVFGRGCRYGVGSGS